MITNQRWFKLTLCCLLLGTSVQASTIISPKELESFHISTATSPEELEFFQITDKFLKAAFLSENAIEGTREVYFKTEGNIDFIIQIDLENSIEEHNTDQMVEILSTFASDKASIAHQVAPIGQHVLSLGSLRAHNIDHEKLIRAGYKKLKSNQVPEYTLEKCELGSMSPFSDMCDFVNATKESLGKSVPEIKEIYTKFAVRAFSEKEVPAWLSLYLFFEDQKEGVTLLKKMKGELAHYAIITTHLPELREFVAPDVVLEGEKFFATAEELNKSLRSKLKDRTDFLLFPLGSIYLAIESKDEDSSIKGLLEKGYSRVDAVRERKEFDRMIRTKCTQDDSELKDLGYVRLPEWLCTVFQ